VRRRGTLHPLNREIERGCVIYIIGKVKIIVGNELEFKKKNVFEGNEDSFFFKKHMRTPQQLTQHSLINLAAHLRIVPHVAPAEVCPLVFCVYFY
jgi:hypothetical protein